MSCPCIGKLCDKFILSQSVTFTDNTLVINIPNGSYQDGSKYCIVVAQDIPTETTVASPAVITIGDSTTQYPLVCSDCTPVYACSLSSRTRYSTKVETEIGGGVFKMMGRVPCICAVNTPTSLPINNVTTTNTSSSEGGN